MELLAADVWETRSSSDWKSFARKRHLQDQATLNRTYWTTVLAYDIVASNAATGREFEASAILAGTGIASSAESRVRDRRWTIAQRIESANHWLRLNTLLAALSAFERYITAVSDTAIRSNPTGALKWPKKVDGLALQKHRLELATVSARRVREGDWSKRAAEFKKLFGAKPPAWQGNISKLDKMSKIRNGLAHEFGNDRSASYSPAADALTGLRPTPSTRQHFPLTESDLIDYLGTLEKIADEVDRYLLRYHIGGFEIPSIYLDWIDNKDEFEAAIGVSITSHNRNTWIRFRHVLGQLSTIVGRDFTDAMEPYLRTL